MKTFERKAVNGFGGNVKNCRVINDSRVLLETTLSHFQLKISSPQGPVQWLRPKPMDSCLPGVNLDVGCAPGHGLRGVGIAKIISLPCLHSKTVDKTLLDPEHVV